MYSDLLTRIEGEGRVIVEVLNKHVRVKLYFTEPKRYFEEILKNIDVKVGIDIVSRICGFCGISHVYAYVKAFEKHVEIPHEIEDFRKIILYGERIKSHLLHTCFLYLPDILGYNSINELVNQKPELFKQCLKSINAIHYFLAIVSGRIHNIINMRIGGVYYYPEEKEVSRIMSRIKHVDKCIDIIISLISEYAILFKEKHSYKTLYIDIIDNPFYSNRIYCDNKLLSSDFENNIRAVMKKGSNEKRYIVCNKIVITGPLARYNAYYMRLNSETRQWLREHGINTYLYNLYSSIIARLAEIKDSLIGIRGFFEKYKKPQIKTINVKNPDGKYYAFIEAPRGVLYHRYIVENNRIRDALIITPTQLNAEAMEKLTEKILSINIEKYSFNDLRRKAEMLIRSFDPCLSCSVHVVNGGI